jgi:hypothetical protein
MSEATTDPELERVRAAIAARIAEREREVEQAERDGVLLLRQLRLGNALMVLAFVVEAALVLGFIKLTLDGADTLALLAVGLPALAGSLWFNFGCWRLWALSAWLMSLAGQRPPANNLPESFGHLLAPPLLQPPRITGHQRETVFRR